MQFLPALIVIFVAGVALAARPAAAMMPGRVGRRRLTSGRDLDWSPDGTKIVYTAGGAGWVANANGTGARQVVSGTHAPSWSREGERLAVETAEGIRVVRVSDGATLAELGEGHFPTWSPVDDRIAYASPQHLSISGFGVRSSAHF